MPVKTFSRRDFIKVSGIAVGASCLVCSGLGYAVSRTVPAEPTPVTDTPNFRYGESTAMNGRILVLYATRTGSTTGVASAIGETLGTRGFAVDVQPIKENPPVDGYQSIVIGSAVNGGQWLPEAVQYVKDHQAALNRVPVAVFCVHILNLGDDANSRKNRLAYLNSVRELIKPRDEVYFAGIGMDPAEDSGIVRWIVRTFKVMPDGDCRDWKKIRGWGEALFA